MYKKDKYEEMLEQAEDLLNTDLSTSFKDEEAFTAAKVAHLLPDYEKYIERVKNRNGKPEGKTTGFTDIDIATGGLRKKSLWVIGGPPSTGKSAIALQICLNASVDNAKIAIFSMEMSKEDVISRLLGSLGRLSVTAIRNGILEDDLMPHFEEIKKKLAGYDMYIFDDPSYCDLEKVRKLLSNLKLTGNEFDIILMDHLSYFAMKGAKGEYENRTNTIYELFNIAKEMDTCMLVLSQVSLESQKNAADRLHFLGSGEILNCAEVAVQLDRDILGRSSKLRFRMVKNRNGPLMDNITLDYDTETQRIFLPDPIDELNTPLLSNKGELQK